MFGRSYHGRLDKGRNTESDWKQSDELGIDVRPGSKEAILESDTEAPVVKYRGR